MFSDNISGRFVDVVPYDRLEMLWRFKSWPSDHFSHVSIQFFEESDRTKLVIDQKAVPSQFYENTMVKKKTFEKFFRIRSFRFQDGWKRFYLESIKTTFGYGSRLF